MAIETKDLLSFLGVEADNLDAFKEKFETEFSRNANIGKDHPKVKAAVGETLGILEKNLKNIAKNHDAEWQGGEWDQKTLNEKLEHSFGKIVQKHTAVLEDFKKTHTGGNEQVVKEWSEKYTKAEQKAKDIEALLNSTKSEFDTYKQSEAKREKERIIGELKQQAVGKLKFKSTVNDLTKKGFLSAIDESYRIDIDENKVPFVTDSKGQRIPNPKVTGTFMSLEDVITGEAIKADIYEKNPHPQKPAATTTVTTTATEAPTRVINPLAQKASVRV